MSSNKKEPEQHYKILLTSGKIFIGNNIEPRKAEKPEKCSAIKPTHNKRNNPSLSPMIHRKDRSRLNPKLSYIYKLYDAISTSLSLNYVDYKFDNSEQSFEDDDGVYEIANLFVEHKVLGGKIEKDELKSIQLKIKDIFDEIPILITRVNKDVISANINSVILCEESDSYEDNPIYYNDVGASMFVYNAFQPNYKDLSTVFTKYSIVGYGDIELPKPKVRTDKCSSKKIMLLNGVLRRHSVNAYKLIGYHLDTGEKVTLTVQVKYMSNTDIMKTDIIEYENKLHYLVDHKVTFIFEIESTQYFVCHKGQKTNQYQVLFGQRFIEEFKKIKKI